MDITTKTELELKALAFDITVLLKQNEYNLNLIMKELQKFSKKEEVLPSKINGI